MSHWFKNAVVYHIFIDRFSRGKENDEKPISCSGPVFCGGSLTGVLERLDYLQHLGADTIWLSPFNRTSAYHGYHITDFFDVDPHFGSLEVLDVLIKEAHNKGIRVLMDFVPNHVSHKHPYFLDAQKHEQSAYRNWFYFIERPNKYLCFLDFAELPKINLDHIPARDHIVDAAKYWLARGIDGFRLDHVVGPSHAFWKHFRAEIKKAYPDALLIGEAWIRGVTFSQLKSINMRGKYIKWLLGAVSDALLREYIGQLDGVLDFRFQSLLVSFIAKPSPLKPRWLLQWKLNRHYSRYPENYFLPSFLDNHDMTRFMFEAGQDLKKLAAAARIQFAQKQPIIIYYGTEIGMTHEKGMESYSDHGDLVARHMMKWKQREQNQKLLAVYKKLIEGRKIRT